MNEDLEVVRMVVKEVGCGWVRKEKLPKKHVTNSAAVSTRGCQHKLGSMP